MGETNIPTEGPQQQSDAGGASTAASLRLRLFGWVSSAVLRLLGATWRIEILGVDPRDPSSVGKAGTGPRPQLAAVFHESMLPCAWCFRDRGYSVAVSRSRDGELIRATLIALGYTEPARGSSSRGGTVALRGLMRRLDEGTTVAVLVDGPRGPARVAKTGIVSLARRCDVPIQPVAFSARPALRLRSWDRSLVPLPFARVVCAFGPPLVFETGDDDTKEQAAARRLDEELSDLHHEADRVLLSS